MNRRDFVKIATLSTGVLSLDSSLVRAAEYGAGSTLAEIQRVKNPGKLSALEKKHAPLIRLPEKILPGQPFDLQLSVGQTLHPMSAGHYIDYIELYIDQQPAGRCELRPGFNDPVVSFRLRIEGPAVLRVREYCNLHGLWETRLDLQPG